MVTQNPNVYIYSTRDRSIPRSLQMCMNTSFDEILDLTRTHNKRVLILGEYVNKNLGVTREDRPP